MEEALDGFIHDFGYQLVDLRAGRNRAAMRYRLFFDRVDGRPVTLDDCSSLAPQVVLFLEARGHYDSYSSLELSSAGLDRVLKRGRDFERFLGFEVKVTYFEGQRRKSVVGELSSFTDELLVLTQRVDGGEGCTPEAGAGTVSLTIERCQMERARLVPQVEI